MRRTSTIVGLWMLLCLGTQAQYVSYWFQGWQRQGDAADAQAYFMRPGTNVSFSYASNRVYINVAGVISNYAVATNSLWAMYASNAILATNAIWATNWTGSNDMWLSLSNQIISATNGPQWFTNVWGIQAGTNVWFTTNLSAGEQIVSINASNTGGGGSASNMYFTNVYGVDAGTNIVFYTNAGIVYIAVGTNYSPPALNTNFLFAWWQFEEGSGTNAFDSVDTWTGYLTNTYATNLNPTWTAGKIGNFAVSFDQSLNQFVAVPTMTTNYIQVPAGTFSWWQYQTQAWNSASTKGMWGWFGGMEWDCQVYYDGMSGANNTWYVGGGNTPETRLIFAANATNWPVNTWIHYAFTYGTNGQAFYTNGILCASNFQNSGTNVVLTAGEWFHIGELGKNASWFSGQMDDFRIYSTNLTAQQVYDLYQYYTTIMNSPQYVLKSGDTMTGPLVIESTADVSGAVTLSDTVSAMGPAVTMTNLYIQDPNGTNLFIFTWFPVAPGVYSGREWMTSYNGVGSKMESFSYNYLGGTLGTFSFSDNVSSISNIIALGVFHGDGSGLSNLYWTNVLGIVIYPTNITWGGTWSMDGDIIDGIDTMNASTGVFTNGLYGGQISGDGSSITNIASTNIVGTIPVGILPTNVAYLNSNQTFTGINYFTTAASNIFGTEISQTNSIANTFLNLDGHRSSAGNVIEYKTNNSSKFSVTTAGAVSAGSSFFTSGDYAFLAAGNFLGYGTTFQLGNVSGNTANTIRLAGGNSNNGLTNMVFGTVQGSNATIRINGGAFISPYTRPTVTFMNATNGPENVIVSGTLEVTNSITSYSEVIATNFVTSVPKWIDIPMNYGYATLGPSAPALTAVTNGSVIQELAFDNGDILYAQGQMQHNVATTNASFPSWYFEPHVHFTTIGTLDSTHSNVTWRIEWEFANINGGWAQGTNTATMGVTNNYTHYMLELGHITNNTLPHLSAIFRCRLMRPASATQDYSNAHDVLLDGFDLHIPVGYPNAIGSSTDNAP